MMSVCRRAVLQAEVLELGNFQFASGDRANNHLSIERLFEHPLQLKTVLRHLGNLAVRFEPELLVGIPSGGELLADALSVPQYVGVPVAYLDKVEDLPGVKKFAYRTPEDEDMVGEVERLIVVEDFVRKLTSTRGVLEVPGISNKAQAVISVWDRGYHPARGELHIPTEALVTEYIPNFLREADEIYSWGVPAREEA